MAVSAPRRTKSGKIKDTEPYQRSFRRDVFKLLKLGYDKLNGKKYRDSEEEDITGEIIKSINVLLDDPSSPKRLKRYFVSDDPPVNAPGRLGKRRRRVDIEFTSNIRSPRPRYSFEAKRLCKTKGAGPYFGNEGLGMFINGEYARESVEAGMLGYVQSESPQNWSEKLGKYFSENKGKLKARKDGAWKKAEDITNLNYCYTSGHNRIKKLPPITIYHLLLQFC